MKRVLTLTCAMILLLFGLTIHPAQAQGGMVYTVQPGDTLTSIAQGFGVTVDELLTANGLAWDTWVFAGQQLFIPTRTAVPIAQLYNPPQVYEPSPIYNSPQVYDSPQVNTLNQSALVTVQPGDTLAGIAANYGVNAYDLAAINGLSWDSWVYSGQQLAVPAMQNFPAYNQPVAPNSIAQPAPQPVQAYGERWIDVNLTTQTVTAYEGNNPVYSSLVSTGTSQYPTVAGTYKIYVKYEKARMRGGFGADAYDLADVPYVMYFYRGYGLHGTYWHNNFGTPMSHGCVNLSTADAEWFYNWASIGTKVVTHY